MIVTKTYSVDYAHRLKDHPGKCKNLHGHTGVFTITFSGSVKEDGMIIDFGTFGWLEKLVGLFDHTILLQEGDPILDLLFPEDKGEFFDLNFVSFKNPPTAEVIVEDLVTLIENDGIYSSMDRNALRLVRIDFAETPGNVVSWIKE
jgi:6-pyruvoyltetrahydropterin/6-carboxytetrahydropterin synthase